MHAVQTPRITKLDAAIHHTYLRMREFRRHEEHGLAEHCEALMNGYLDARIQSTSAS